MFSSEKYINDYNCNELSLLILQAVMLVLKNKNPGMSIEDSTEAFCC